MSVIVIFVQLLTAMSANVNGTAVAATEKVAILDAGAQYGKVCLCLIVH